MIVQDFHLDRWNWSVRVYYFVDELYYDLIYDDLVELHCTNPEETIDRLMRAGYNSGLTFSSPKERASIIVIGKTTSPQEFQSTIDNEKGHLAIHIALFDDIDFISEDYQYLAGDIGKQTYPVAKYFLCDHCYSDALKLRGKLVEND